jgi:uncharacterized protein YrrD
MRLGKELENKPIISVSDGRILGRAKDVYLDKDLKQLAGLFVGTEGVIRRKELIISSEDIVLLGIDVILVKDPDVITTTKARPETDDWHRLAQLHGEEVRTPGGTKLATIGDVILDEKGAISGFTLERVFVSGPLAAQPTVPREVVVDPFQTSDSLIVDFPALEAMFKAQGAPPASGTDSGETDEDTEVPEQKPVEPADDAAA